jgi:anion-transporting  ArsA/GET3 family ATPase
MTPPVPASLPLESQRLIVVTGKGGVGKSAVTAALARAVAAAGRRVLAVEIGRTRLGALLGASQGGLEPQVVSPGLSFASVEPEEALSDFVHGMLRFRALSRRLLESTSFQVLAAAAPGLPEFLVLQKLHSWLDTRRLGRRVFDAVVVDAPASGHSLPLLAAPRTLLTLARIGPVADKLAAVGAMLADPETTLVCLVTTPEELAVRETIELHRELARRLDLPVGPAIVNAVPPRHFGAADEAALARLEARGEHHPWFDAARFLLERRRQAARQVQALRRALGTAPVRLPFLFAGPESEEGLDVLTTELARAARLAA